MSEWCLLCEESTLIPALTVSRVKARWTNDKYSSTLHRVISPAEGQSRYSVALFLMGDMDYVIECLPTCREEGREPKYEPITVERYLMNKIQETYSK